MCVNNSNQVHWHSVQNKIAATFVPYYALNEQIEGIKQRVLNNSSYTLSNSDRIVVQKAVLKCNKPFTGNILKNLSQLPCEEIKKVIFNILENDNETEIISTLDQLLKSLKLEDLMRFSSLGSEKLNEILKQHALLKNSVVRSAWYTKSKAVLKEILYEIFYFCHHLIDTFISISGFTEIGGRKSNRYVSSTMSSYEAKAKIEFYMALLAYPSLIFASFFAILGSAPAALIVTGGIIAASILFIPIYNRFLRPCPNQYTGLENLNKKVLRKENPPTFQRLDVLERIQNAFCAGKGVILTADSGIGKTTIATSLAELIVKKKTKKAAAFLNKAQLFSVNANQLKGTPSMDGLTFGALAEHFKEHARELILFIDEFPALFGPQRADKAFLTFCDNFPQVICATTRKEYEELIKKDHSINRRLVHIELDPLTPKELETVLYEYLHNKAPELFLEENIIPYIMEKASEFNSKTSQVDAALSLLKAAIVKASHITFEGLEKEINDLKIEIQYLKNHFRYSENAGSINVYEEKKAALTHAKKRLAEKTKTLNRIKKIEAITLEMKHRGYLLANRETASNLSSKKWLTNYTAQQVLTQFIGDKRKELGLPRGLNRTLIDALVAA